MRFLVLAHPRCGTGYTAACFREAGLDVGHEKMGQDGISSWMWAVLTHEVPWGHARARFPASFCASLIHVVRNPIDAIASVAFTEHASEPFRRRFVFIPHEPDEVVRAIWSLVGWSGLIRGQSPDHTWKLERIESHVSQMTGQEITSRNETRNSRSHPSLSREEVCKRIVGDRRSESALAWLEAQWEKAA